MKIKWNFKKDAEFLAEAIGSTHAFSKKCGKVIFDEISIHGKENQKLSRSGFIEKIINATNPQSPGDVILIGLLVGGAFYAEKTAKLADLLDHTMGRTIDLSHDAIDCYNREEFKNNMYNNENDF